MRKRLIFNNIAMGGYDYNFVVKIGADKHINVAYTAIANNVLSEDYIKTGQWIDGMIT